MFKNSHIIEIKTTVKTKKKLTQIIKRLFWGHKNKILVKIASVNFPTDMAHRFQNPVFILFYSTFWRAQSITEKNTFFFLLIQHMYPCHSVVDYKQWVDWASQMVQC